MRKLSTTQLIALGFATTIFLGAILLSLPMSAADGQFTPFLPALFTATTSVCVTGLVVVDTYAHFSLFGQIVILILIQCGGLGIISITTGVMLMIGKKFSLKDSLLLEDAFNLNSLNGLSLFLKRVFKGTFLIEAIGAIGYMFVFVPRFGTKGVWYSVFTAVSAFCNAGIDVMGSNSLMDYTGNIPVNLITMTLIIVSGLGYIVWWDILRVCGMWKRKEIKRQQLWNRLTLHSKIVLLMTVFLVCIGFIVVLAVEYHNPDTLGSLPLGEKIMAAFFQSVTCRTAGFATISQAALKDATALFCMLLMFIGGSPVGTAGGIKTTTVAVIFIAAMAIVRGNEDAVLFGRTISIRNVRKALAVTLISLLVAMGSLMILLCIQPGNFIDIAYEVFSAVGTVGLTRNLTPSLNSVGRVIIILCMYMGRIGPISMAIAFGKKGKKVSLTYPKEEVTIG